jgi:hypothetical protein
MPSANPVAIDPGPSTPHRIIGPIPTFHLLSSVVESVAGQHMGRRFDSLGTMPMIALS